MFKFVFSSVPHHYTELSSLSGWLENQSKKLNRYLILLRVLPLLEARKLVLCISFGDEHVIGLGL